jgi:hypothetical protein
MSVIKISLDEGYQATGFDDSQRVESARLFARRLPNGYVKKITWDEEGGYPEHAWGYVQYSPRPFRQGYGCDGTTDNNIHLIAAVFCNRLGLDYIDIYKEAYPDSDGVEQWIANLLGDKELREETIIPEVIGMDELILTLSDLYQINNRSLVSVLEERLLDKGFDVQEWHLEEERLHAWKE